MIVLELFVVVAAFVVEPKRPGFGLVRPIMVYVLAGAFFKGLVDLYSL